MSAATAASLAPGWCSTSCAIRRARPGSCELLALALARYTPAARAAAPMACCSRWPASLRLFGGLRALCAWRRATPHDCGTQVRASALAPTAGGGSAAGPRGAGAARCAGHARSALLDACRCRRCCEALQQPPRLAELLQAIGSRRLADVRALPRAGLQKRGGAELLGALDRAYGDAPDPRPWFEPPERFAMALELMHRADDAGATRRSPPSAWCRPLAGWLSRQWLARSRLRLVLRHERSRARAGRQRAAYGSRRAVAGCGADRDAAAREAFTPRAGRTGVRDGAACSTKRCRRAGRDRPAFARSRPAGAGVPGAARPAGVAPGRRPRARASPWPTITGPSGRAWPSGVTGVRAPQVPRHRRRCARPGCCREPLRLADGYGRPVHGGPLPLLTRAERIEAGWFDGALVVPRLPRRPRQRPPAALDLSRAPRRRAGGEADGLRLVTSPRLLRMRHSPSLPAYAELHCLSNFSFLRGASHPQELVRARRELGYAALAITDECSLAGVVRAQRGRGRSRAEERQPASLHRRQRVHAGRRRPALPAGAAGPQPRGLRQPVRADHPGRGAQPQGQLPADAGDLGAAARRVAHRAAAGLPGAADARAAATSADALAARRRAWLAATFGEPRAGSPSSCCSGPTTTRRRAAARGSRRPAGAAAGGRRRRAHARALAQAAAGRADRRSASAAPVAECGYCAGAATPSSTCARACGWRSSTRAELLRRHAWTSPRAARFSLDELRYEYPDEVVPPGETPTGYLRRRMT